MSSVRAGCAASAAAATIAMTASADASRRVMGIQSRPHAVAWVQRDDEERGDRTEEKRDEEPRQPAAPLSLREPGVDQRKRSPPDGVLASHKPSASRRTS